MNRFVKPASVLLSILAVACATKEEPKPVPEPAPAPVAAPAPAPAPAPKAPVPKPLAAQRVTLAADVLFDFDQSTLRPDGRAQLDDLVGKARTATLERIVVSGHADRIGRPAYNQGLSERRAQSVKAYLASKGIDERRMEAYGRGEAQPVTGTKCMKMGKENRHNKKLIACLQPDRRVEIEVAGTRMQ